jgi:hypothetical protein
MMPSAVAGGTLLARAALDEDERITVARSRSDRAFDADRGAMGDGSG